MRPAAWLTLALLLATAATGYGGFRLSRLFELESATGAGLFGLAVLAGVASLFSPCSFPLLATLFSRYSGDTGDRHLGPALRFAGALSIGVTAFLVLLGLALGAGGAAVAGDVTFTSTGGRVLRAVVATALLAFAAIHLGWVHVDLFGRVPRVTGYTRAAERRLRDRSPLAGTAVYGFGYVLGGFG